MAKEIKKMHEDEKNLRLNKNEIAREFYDDEILKKIAQQVKLMCSNEAETY